MSSLCSSSSGERQPFESARRAAHWFRMTCSGNFLQPMSCKLAAHDGGCLGSSRGRPSSGVEIRPVEDLTPEQLAQLHPCSLSLDCARFELNLFRGTELVRVYRAAVGLPGKPTPPGLHRIHCKLVNPVYKAPRAGRFHRRRIIPPGSENPLKARWLGFFPHIGVHGTEEIWSLGTRSTLGCIRLSVPDVVDVYERVDIGTPLWIE
jgi:L,D-transpeptidase-like protein